MFEEIVQKYREELIKFCVSYMHRGYADAEDVVQEVFLALFRKKNINLNDNIRAWLYNTARHKIMKHIRKNPLFENITAACEKTDPISEQFKDSVLDVLTDKEYELIKSYYMDEDPEEIASKNGMTVNALYCKIKRIRKKLSDGLNEQTK